MELTLHTETVIDSCHYLNNYKGKCAVPHGHSWLIEIWIKGESRQKDNVGILFDFGNIQKIKEKYDHKVLNEIYPFNRINPTAENLTEQIYSELHNESPLLKFKVRVYETKVGKTTYCEGGDF